MYIYIKCIDTYIYECTYIDIKICITIDLQSPNPQP